MALTRLSLSNYRCFEDTQDIELRPLTILLGRNNSGKSALARAPLVWSTGVRTDSSAPLDLELLDEQLLGGFTDLIYGNRPHGNISASFDLANDNGGEQVQLNVEVQNIAELRTQIVSKLALKFGKNNVSYTWEQSEGSELENQHTVEVNGQALENIRFRGFLPDILTASRLVQAGDLTNTARILQDVVRRVTRSFPEIRYIGPFRERPDRLYRFPSRRPKNVGARGEQAAGILAADMLRDRSKLLQRVNAELESCLPGWNIDITERGDMFSLVLTSLSDASLTVNIADGGAGVAQVLPIFVQRALDILSPPRRPVLEIVEQPELHLHPAAHAALADLYLEAIRLTSVRFIVETHSETLLLRLRRRIAEGLDPSFVALYFVDHDGSKASVKKINIDEKGSLDYWPAGVFSEDYDEARKLTKAQLANGLDDAR